ncbi:MAG TPA: M23 family metallopeptidase [Leptospiraceae bacterium]|nr:M23 family metallopeptidase [Leptospiraceae bacterium]
MKNFLSFHFSVRSCLLFFSLLLFSVSALFPFDAPVLKNLDYENPDLKLLRDDIKHNLKVSKSARTKEPFRSLRFVKYTVKEKDTFFVIMARTGMDIDTLSSVNSLSSPQDIYAGMVLYIPNMRGIYDTDSFPFNEEGRVRLAEKYRMREDLFLEENHFRKEWFVPGRTLGRIEKTFFYGLAFTLPLKEGYFSSGYGSRKDPFTKKKTFHGGIDIAAPEGTDVHSSADGEVIFAGKKGGYGNLVVVKHILGFETRYGHLSEFSVKKGQRVRKREKIAEVGSTGRSPGPHLHFEVRRFNKNQKPEFNKHM